MTDTPTGKPGPEIGPHDPLHSLRPAQTDPGDETDHPVTEAEYREGRLALIEPQSIDQERDLS